MGVFRRHEPSREEQQLKDRFVIRTDSDGTVREQCWFCGRDVEYDAKNPTGDAAAVLIEPLGGGEPEHGICHRECAERAKGSLAF
jgi:hypothetical protein